MSTKKACYVSKPSQQLHCGLHTLKHQNSKEHTQHYDGVFKDTQGLLFIAHIACKEIQTHSDDGQHQHSHHQKAYDSHDGLPLYSDFAKTFGRIALVIKLGILPSIGLRQQFAQQQIVHSMT